MNEAGDDSACNQAPLHTGTNESPMYVVQKGSIMESFLQEHSTNNPAGSLPQSRPRGGGPKPPLGARSLIAKGRLEMSDGMTDVISITTVHRELEGLLAGYLSEQEESRRDEDTYFIDYWDSACQTIYDVAAALNIALEEQPSKRRPRKLDSMTDLPTSDVALPEGSIGSYN